ncbi:MAG TPA: hypothetical protein VGX25_21995 [Actinophytocola sp.]|uniref:hypothetical protein n=1 Tax=Actinophytocola sp. TaxID=1872138 RepID=UPI002DDD7234|nr:hypothetical protein [Actinophytocola sp.]HEV2782072.1 hypothetical protein [Actinophytocola sp.]
MSGTLHVQAGVWGNHGGSRAVLCMEGEAADRANGGGVTVDALYRAVLGRGLHLTTDLEHLDPRPIPGWWVWIDPDGAVTLEWPRFRPLLEHVPLDLPGGWRRVADDEHAVVVFVGYGLGEHPLRELEHAARTGALASGVVPVRPGPPGSQHLVL